MYTDEHGGGCCGVSHIYSFPSLDEATETELDYSISNVLQDLKDRNCDEDTGEPLWKGDEFSHLFEVVLTDNQMNLWAELLKKKGFKYVCRWLNDNSGNHCNLLVYMTNGEAKPYAW